MAFHIRTLFFSSPQQAIEECEKCVLCGEEEEGELARRERANGVNKSATVQGALYSKLVDSSSSTSGPPISSGHNRSAYSHSRSVLRPAYVPSHSLRAFDKRARTVGGSSSYPAARQPWFGWKKIASEPRCLVPHVRQSAVFPSRDE